jgi:DNA polymerase/3'-5' exonuclease PolX
MELKQAQEIANELKLLLSPYCERIEIAGFIRRKKEFVKDIELVCIPKKDSIKDLFGGEIETIHSFHAVLCTFVINKGNTRNGKYIQFQTQGINVDLFTATKENFGLTLAVRTGAAYFSHNVLAKGWVRNGFTSKENILYKKGVAYPIYTEKDLFDLIGIEFIAPENRI